MLRLIVKFIMCVSGLKVLSVTEDNNKGWVNGFSSITTS